MPKQSKAKVNYFQSFSQRKGVGRKTMLFGSKRVTMIALLLFVTSGVVGLAILQQSRESKAATIFSTGFENGSLSEWGGGQCMNSYSCTASTNAPREGNYSSRYEVRDGDCPVTGDRCYGERAERQGGAISSGMSSNEGQNRWYSWSMKLENGFPNSSGWQVLSQWHSSSNGSPAIAYKINGRTLFLEHYSPSAGYKHQFYSALSTGQWYDLKMNIYWTSASSGYVRLWINGQEQARYNGPTLRAGEGTYFKQGYYRDQNVSGTGIVYYDNIKAATAESDLGGSSSTPPAPQPQPEPQPQPQPQPEPEPQPQPQPQPEPAPVPKPTTQAPHGGTAKTIPGKLEAEDFDEGGEGVSYHDTDNVNRLGQYRDTAVDIERSSEGGYNVGWNDPGEWREHTVNAQAGAYTISARVSSAVSDGKLVVKIDGQTLGTLNVPNTGGWQTYQNATLSNITIPGGNNKVIRFETAGNAYTIESVSFSKASTTTTPTPTPTPTTPAAQSTVEAENATRCELIWTSNTSCGRALTNNASSGATNNTFVNLTHQYSSLTQNFKITQSGSYKFGFTLAGEEYRGEPKIDLYLNGSKIISGYTIDEGFEYKYLERTLSQGDYTLKVVFVNDKCGDRWRFERCTPENDRNLWVDQFRLSKN